MLNALLTAQSSNALSAEEKQAHSNLISTLVSGVAAATGTQAVTAIVSARTETENNYLKAPQVKELFDDMMVCRGAADPSACRQETQAKYEKISKERGGAALYGCKAGGEAACERQLSQVEAGSKRLDALESFGWTDEELAVLDPLIRLNHDESFAARYIWIQSFYADSGITGGILLGGVAGLTAAKAELTAVKTEAAVGKESAKGIGGTIDRTTAGIEWGKGIQGQGVPWENYLETQLPAQSRLPQNFKTFDFFDRTTGAATSAKTLDTTTVAKVANPKQIYSSLKRNIDEAAEFIEYGLKRIEVKSSQIASRELQVAIPKSTTKEQWIEINKAIEYGQSRGIIVKITKVD